MIRWRLANERSVGNANPDVVVVIPNIRGGGSQRVAVNLVNEWANQGLRVCLVSLSPTEPAYPIADGVRLLVLPLVNRDRSWLTSVALPLVAPLRLRTVLARLSASTIISFGFQSNVLTMVSTLGSRSRIVLSERNDPRIQSFGRHWDLLRRVLYRFADLVTANSAGTLEALAQYVPDDKLMLVRNPVVIPKDVRREPFAEPTVISVGRLHHQKGHDVLLAAFAHSHARALGWQLLLLGEGEERSRWQQLAEEFGISDRVQWKGHVPDPFPYLASADIFVLASRYEGMPNALLEAMALGVAPIVTDASPGPTQYVVDGVTGLVVPVEDTQALAAALNRLMLDQDLRNRLGEAARRKLGHDIAREAFEEWNSVLDTGGVAGKSPQ